jgi:hypothetical protein
MPRSKNQKIELSFPVPRLTITESWDELAALCQQVNDEIQPTGFIEQIYVGDIIANTLDILRLRRAKTGIINAAFLAALETILEQLLSPEDYEHAHHQEQAAKELARQWFENAKAKTQVRALLRKFGLDESSIEAEAFRSRAAELESLDRMLALAGGRRDKALRSIADYRQSLAKQIQQSTDRILDNDNVPRLVAIDERSG